MRNFSVSERKEKADKFANKVWREHTCYHGAWNRNKILELAIKKLKKLITDNPAKMARNTEKPKSKPKRTKKRKAPPPPMPD